jgi:hypothetical protein
MNRSYIVMVLCLFFVLMGACDSGGGHMVPHSEEALSALIAERFVLIGSQLGKTWDVLGLLRSITIQPQYRARFLQNVFSDMVGVLEEVARLSAYCGVSNDSCHRFLLSFEDVGEHFSGVTEEFRAVCIPPCGGEEKVVDTLIQHAATIFSDCWSQALKVGATAKANK